MQIKLERMNDSENKQFEDIYLANFYEFFELVQISQNTDINTYIFDKFSIQRDIKAKGRKKKYMLHYNIAHENEQINGYELKQENIDNGLLKEMEFFKEYDNIEFRVSTMYYSNY